MICVIPLSSLIPLKQQLVREDDEEEEKEDVTGTKPPESFCRITAHQRPLEVRLRAHFCDVTIRVRGDNTDFRSRCFDEKARLSFFSSPFISSSVVLFFVSRIIQSFILDLNSVSPGQLALSSGSLRKNG